MNTKGIKFLAVLAVMVMAFAAVIVLAPADKGTDAVTFTPAQWDPKVLDSTVAATLTEYYISDDATVKVKSLTSSVTIYVQNGKELILDIRENLGDKTITVKTVTSDLQAHTTSTIDTNVWTGQVTGKTYIESSKVTFSGVKAQTFVYKAMEPTVTTTYDTSKGINVSISTSKKYAYVSSDEVLKSAIIGAGVAVAENQYIVTDNSDNVAVKYGVMVKDNNGLVTGTSTTAASYTYYATGMSAGTATLESGDQVLVKDGSVTAKAGSASVKVSGVSNSGAAFTIDFKATNQLKISNNIESGAVVIDGEIEVSNVTIKDDAVLTASTGAKFIGTSKVIVDGTFVTKVDKNELKKIAVDGSEALKGVVKVENKKAWTYSGRTPSIELKGGSTFKGLIDVSSITESAPVIDSSFSTANVAPDQTFIFTKNTLITSSVTVEGILIIEEGVTVTLTKTQDVGAALILTGPYAQVINYGQIMIKTAAPSTTAGDRVGLHVHGGLFTNYGKVAASSESSVGTAETLCVDLTASSAKGLGFLNEGEVTISKTDTVHLTNKFYNEGSLSIGGKFVSSDVTFRNAGIFSLTNATINTKLTVEMEKGAIFNLVSAKFSASKDIVVKHESGTDAVITITGDADEQVHSVVICDTTTKLRKQLDLSGSIRATGLAESGKVVMTMNGNIAVTDDTTVAKGFELVFTGKAEVNVSGDLVLADGVICSTEGSGNLTMNVTGSVTCIADDILDQCTFSGARYSLVTGTTIYTNIDDALADAAELDADLVEVGSLGATLTAELSTIPAGMALSGVGNAVLKVGDSDNVATLAIEEGAAISFAKKVEVINGGIFVENEFDLSKENVKADVKDVDDESNVAAYTSLKYALAHSIPGTVIELSQPFVMTSDELVIPEGVLVNATAEDRTDFVLIDSDLVVNGVLMLDKFQFIATTDDTKSITVGDRIMEDNEDGLYLKNKWYTPIGVSYQWTVTDDDGDENTWFVITNLANLQDAIDDADDAKVTVEGSPKLGDIAISGRDDMPAEVTFNGNINAGTILLDNVTIIALKDNQINASFANALGSITITGAYVKGTTMSIYSLDDGVVTMNGALRDDASGTYGILFEGITGMEDATIGWGNTVNDFPTIVFNGTTTATGKKNMIQNYVADDRYINNAGIVTISGILIADNGTRLNIDADVEVPGALIAAERSEGKVEGSIEINGDVFVGAFKSEIYDVEAAIAATDADPNFNKHPAVDRGYGKTVYTAAAGILDGKIILGKIAASATTPAKDCFITVLEGSEIDSQIIEDLDSMDVIIEGVAWVTVYGAPTAHYSLDGLKAPIFNAKVSSILDYDGNEIAKFSHTYKVVYGCKTERTLASIGEVFITLDYKAFTVTIKTDGSVKAVYIDGILMYTGENRNTFQLDKIEAGTHKVTVEAATGYDADKCVLYTDMGTILPGMSFTFTEYDCEDYNIIYNINGTEIQPEPVPPTPEEESQWTITTILLVILVVLIAIMAVIVALRLNRS